MVEVLETGRNAGDAATQDALDRAECGHERILPGDAAAGAEVGDGEDLLLGLGDDLVGGRLLRVALPFDVVGAVNGAAQKGLLPDDVDVVLRVGGGRCGVDKSFEEGGAADRVEKSLGAQALEDGEHVDDLALCGHLLEDAVKGAVCRDVEAFRRGESIFDAEVEDARGIQQY